MSEHTIGREVVGHMTNEDEDLMGLETRRAHRRHERIGQFIEQLIGKHGKMTARQLLTVYIDEKWPFKTMKPRVDANQISKLVKKYPNIVTEPKGNVLTYDLRKKSSGGSV